MPFNSAPLLKDHCVACFAAGDNRDKWCPTPQTCWSSKGASAHSRVYGYPDSACKYITVPKDFDWATATCLVKPRRGAGGKKDAGAQGRGAGQGSKGSGKGGKGGKGGSGKGGKGSSYFTRQ